MRPQQELNDYVCDLTSLTVNSEPFPHIIHDQFINPTVYGQLCESFPTCPPKGGPTGFSLFWGDDEYERLLAERPVWQLLFNTFHNQKFIDWARDQFASFWTASGCTIDLAKARYVPYREDRIDKERATLRKVEYPPHDLWVRMDIHQGNVGYDRPVHVDHRRRLISMLIYLCDPAESQIEGGDLLLHTGSHISSPFIRVTPRHNRMVCFPCTAHSYHSVTPITSLLAPRNYLQVHISSSVDAWTDNQSRVKTGNAIKTRSKIWASLGVPDARGESASLETSTSNGSELSKPAPADRLELETSRTKLLATLDGATDVTIIRNPGHIGDQLIHAGMRRLLAGIDYREVSLREIDGLRGELAIITGSGGWCEAHQHLPPYLPKIEQQFERVVVFPSSFDTSVKNVRKALERTRALVFAREFVSYEQIRPLCRADVAHDTAFFFDFEPYRRQGNGTLITFRTDREAAMPVVPVDNRDISLTCDSLDEFLWTIARYELVETDRAHVMIAAALLGNEVHYSASNYHKLPGLASSSLQDYPVFAVARDASRRGRYEVTAASSNYEIAQNQREQLLTEILNSRSFRLISFYWRLRKRTGI